MITILATALLLQQSSTPEVLPFAWERAKRVRIQVIENELKVPFAYEVGLKVFVGEEGKGVTLHRDKFEASSVAGHEVEDGGLPGQFREWAVRMKHVPNLCIDEAGKLKFLTQIKRSEDEYFAEMTEGLEGSELTAARIEFKPGEDRDYWLEPRRLEWQRLSEWWTGLPLAAGSSSVDRKLYLGMPRLEWLDVQVHLEVSERFEEDGRQLVRLETILRLNREVLGKNSLRYLRFIRANPSETSDLQDFETFYRSNATFDVETWLPTKVHTSRKTRLGMATTRSAWVEEVLEEHHYELDWDLRKKD